MHPRKNSGAALFLGGGPPKIPTFSGSDSERLERGPQCSARRRNLQKPLRTIVVLRIAYNPTRRNDSSSQYPRCPHQKNKNDGFCPTRGGFLTLGSRTSRVLGENSDMYVRLFEISTYRMRYGEVSPAISR